MRKLKTNELNRLSVSEFRLTQKMPLVIVLDNVRSQHNVGSIFRTADAFRLERICLCGITATPPHREINKTALGATESVRWDYYPETVSAIDELKNQGYLICCVEQTDTSISLSGFHPLKNSKIALVFGNEVHGIEQYLMALADKAIEIPQFGTKHSLNIAVAAGIVIWDMFQKINSLNEM